MKATILALALAAALPAAAADAALIDLDAHGLSETGRAFSVSAQVIYDDLFLTADSIAGEEPKASLFGDPFDPSFPLALFAGTIPNTLGGEGIETADGPDLIEVLVRIDPGLTGGDFAGFGSYGIVSLRGLFGNDPFDPMSALVAASQDIPPTGVLAEFEVRGYTVIPTPAALPLLVSAICLVTALAATRRTDASAGQL